MRTLSLSSLFVLVSALSLCLFFAFQYPLQTTFPIGGDAPHYIQLAQSTLRASQSSISEVLSSFLQSAYPLSHALFLISSLIPISWPERFTLWMSLGHIFASFGLGLFIYRLAGWRSAATAIAAWALTTTVVNTHFEDATLAQLWSLVFIFLFFERVAAKSPFWAFAFFLLTWLTHPFSGFILLSSAITASPFLFLLIKKISPDHKRTIQTLFFTSLIFLVVGLIILKKKYDIINYIPIDTQGLLLANLVRSQIGPFLLLSPIGFFLLLKKNRVSPSPILFILTSFCLIAIFTSFSHYLGLELLSHRFQTYFISSIIILSSLALPNLIKLVFKSPALSTIFIAILFSFLSLTTWQSNDSIYHRYESPHRYQRIHPQELEAIYWMGINLPPESIIITSASSRHTEWIPVLTSLNWSSLSSSDSLFNSLHEEYLDHREATISKSVNSPDYYAFFTNVDDVHRMVFLHPEVFPIVYKNDAVTLVKSP